VDVNGFEGASLDVRYYATNGTRVREHRVSANNSEHRPVSLDLSGLPQGLYHIILSDGVREGVARVVKE
jgi:hypothetical protein